MKNLEMKKPKHITTTSKKIRGRSFLDLLADLEKKEITEQESKELQIKLEVLEGSARCVPVGTILIAPDGRNEKKESFKGKSEWIKFRCSIYEKKMLKIKAKQSGITLSEFCRKSIYEKDIKERLSDDHIEIYKTLVKFHNNFKSIGNMFRKRDPKLSKAVYDLADEIKVHLKKIY